MGWRPFRRTSFNSILTLVHPLVLQLREYPLKPVSFTLCHFYLRSISPLLFSSQLSSISAACFPVSIHCPADVRLCGVVEQAKDEHGWPQSKYDKVRLAPFARRLAMRNMHTVSAKGMSFPPILLCFPVFSSQEKIYSCMFLVYLVRSMDSFNALGSTVRV